MWVDEEKNIAYVSCGYYGVRIFNISNPSDPTLLSHIPESAALLNTGHDSAYAHQLIVNNDIIYVGDGPGGLTIINCSNFSNPTVLIHYIGGYTWDIQLVDNFAFIANGWNNLDNPGLMILNVTDPSNPNLLSNYQTDFDVTDLELLDARAYLVKSDSGLYILDISNYTNPTALGYYLGPSGSYAVDVEISGNLAFLTLWKEGLKILDISDPADITVISEFKGNNMSEFTFLTLDDNFAYLATMDDGVVVLNISDPYFPTEISIFNDSGKAYGIFVRDNFIFVADQLEGLKILEITGMNHLDHTTTRLESDTSTQWSSTSSMETPSFSLIIGILAFVILRLSKMKKKKVN